MTPAFSGPGAASAIPRGGPSRPRQPRPHAGGPGEGGAAGEGAGEGQQQEWRVAGCRNLIESADDAVLVFVTLQSLVALLVAHGASAEGGGRVQDSRYVGDPWSGS